MGASVGAFESYFLVMVCKVESKLDIGCSIEIDALNQGLRSLGWLMRGPSSFA